MSEESNVNSGAPHSTTPPRAVQLTHSPETGLYDIKPLELQTVAYSTYLLYFLVMVCIFSILYLLRKHLSFRSHTVKKSATSPDIQFQNTINTLKINSSNYDFRTYCEALSEALKNVLSWFAGYRLTPLTSDQLKLYLKKNANSLAPQNQAETFLQFTDQLHTLVSMLEGGEYGDLKTISSLQLGKEKLTQDTEEAGIFIISMVRAREGERQKVRNVKSRTIVNT